MSQTQHETDKNLQAVPIVGARSRRPRMHHNAIVVASALLLVAIGIALYPIYTLFYAVTNDAQVDGHILPVNTRINGTVTWVDPNAENTRHVEAGEVLAVLDPNDYTPSVDRLRGEVQSQQSQLSSSQLEYAITRPTAQSHLQTARAAVSEAEADLASSLSAVQASEARLEQTRASWEQLEADRKRYQALVGTHEISNSEYDQRATAATTAHEQMKSMAADLKAAQTRTEALRQRLEQRKSELLAANVVPQTVGDAEAHVKQMNGHLQESQAQLRQALLDLDYTTIRAPMSGIVGQRQFELGQRVDTGHLMVTVTPLNNLWVTANYKETQLRRMRIGQPAIIKIDSWGEKLHGHVESIGGATGARYSLLPPENATGNYVKVVQRIPVRIHIDDTIHPQRPLLPGMSVEVSVQLF